MCLFNNERRKCNNIINVSGVLSIWKYNEESMCDNIIDNAIVIFNDNTIMKISILMINSNNEMINIIIKKMILSNIRKWQ